jgi:hypothetical protein
MLNEENVERAILASFEKSFREDVRAAITLYSGPEVPRVRLAILALAESNPDKVLALVEAACRDYRDLLYWAEYPEECGGKLTRNEMATRYSKMGVPIPKPLLEPR